jgi:hypothetical protein
LHVSGMLPDLGIVAMLLEVTRTIGRCSLLRNARPKAR